MTEAAAVPVSVLRHDRPPTRTTPVRRRSAPALLWFLLAAVPAVVAHALALGRTAVATAGEASTAAAAFAEAGPDASPFTVPLLDRLAVQQFAVLDVLVGDPRGGTVLDGARATSLAASLVTCLLLWGAARRLGFRPPAAAAAVALAGVPAALVALHGAIDAGVLAALWLTLAAAVPGGSLPLRALAALAAVLTVPIAAVGVLLFAAYLVVTGVIFPAWRSAVRLVVTVLLVDGAVLVGVLATGDRPLAVLGDAGVPRPVVLVVVALGALLAIAVWQRRSWLRPVAAGAAGLLVCALVPGPAEGTALLVALPALAVLAASLLDGELGAVSSRRTLAATVAAAIALAALAAPTLFARTDGEERLTGLADWIVAEVDPATVLAVDELTWAQLVRDGVPAQRLAATGGPMGTAAPPPDALQVAVPRPGRRTSWRPDGVSVPVASAGAAIVRQRIADPAAHRAAAATDLADRAAFGTTIAGNAALALSEEADRALRAGEVDARLMTVLATFASAHRFAIDDFPAAALDALGTPRRTVLITGLDGRPAGEQGVADLARQWFDAQLAPYHPLSIQLAGDALLVRYAAPAPLGLLAG